MRKPQAVSYTPRSTSATTLALHMNNAAHADNDQAPHPKNSDGCGKVTLVGAGPGAADLLTLRAIRVLQCADVILFDDLVSDEVLDFTRREAKRITVGKRGGRSSCKQDDINALMVKLARQGKHVVRLKSGDPMIFGRAGEEITQLDLAGIDVEIVPGITAAIAAAAETKTSLTHRDHAQSVKFITAHSREGRLPDLDWRTCADLNTTLVVYMGARTAPLLATRLLDEGLPSHTPVRIGRAVSRNHAEYADTDLSSLQNMEIDHAHPVLITIGTVNSVKLSEKSKKMLKIA